MNLKKGDMFRDSKFGHIFVNLGIICADSAMAELNVFDVINNKLVERNFLAIDFVLAGYHMIGKV